MEDSENSHKINQKRKVKLILIVAIVIGIILLFLFILFLINLGEKTGVSVDGNGLEKGTIENQVSQIKYTRYPVYTRKVLGRVT